ncbi:hypothetical protein C2845_PMPSC042091 [Panicum miliaceum]|uniref:F-box domain-containing protein n=1 Tax=Panicum miliaceum TaxID=4540 RepID=A0A3L6PCJ1_PANMI|nr:hypothetical protein C2845_PMPSC042091 [Panicum miliaceum]
MATEEGSDGGGVDRISSLPDDLLHVILIRLRDAAAAARTSVLSRRWRRVWAHLPELSFRYRYAAAAGGGWAHSLVDAALAAYAGTTVRLLEIALHWTPSAHGVCPLMQFASQRVAGELRLSLQEGWGDFVLPTCKRATAITLSVTARTLRFPPQPALGTFAALASLRIIRAGVDGRELGDVLNSHCPRLKELFLKQVVVLRSRDLATPVLSIRSYSLERLEMDMDGEFDAGFQVIAPKLKVFSSPRIFSEAHIVTPKLLEVCWHGPYDPDLHHVQEAGRHLQRLEIARNCWNSRHAAKLMHRFNAVDELQLTVLLWKGIQGYNECLELINSLSKCEVLVVGFVVKQHAIKPVMIHLINKCAGVKKIVVRCLAYRKDQCQCKSWECQCDWSKQSHHKINDAALGSLELVEIKENMEAYHKVEFVKLLCEYSATFQKRVTIDVIENRRSEYMREKIRSIHVPNDKIVINVRSTYASWGT